MLTGVPTTNQQNLNHDKPDDLSCDNPCPNKINPITLSKIEEVPLTSSEKSGAIESHIFVASQFNYCAQQVGVLAGTVFLSSDTVLTDDDGEVVVLEGEVRGISTGIGFVLGMILYGCYYRIKRFLPFFKKRKNKNDQIDNNASEQTEELKKKLVTWADRYETGSMLGNQLGQSIAALIPIPSDAISSLLKLVLGSSLGFFIGITMAIGITDAADDKKAKLSIFKLGKDRWPSYTKTGMLVGGLIGTLLIGLICLFIPIPISGGIFAQLALGGSLGSAVGFIGLAGAVPLTNKLKKYINRNNEIELEDFAAEKEEEILYRTNYIRAGASIGMAIGGVIGYIIGSVPPFNLLPFSAYLLGALFSSVFGLIGGAVLGRIGPYLTTVIDPQRENLDKWDYGVRAAASYGNEIGKVTNNIGRTINGDISGLNNVVGGTVGLVGVGIAAVHDIFYPTKNTENTIFPWSKRLWIFGTIFGTLGAIIGIAGGPLGVMIGYSVGSIIGGAIGIKYGEVLCEKILAADIKFVNQLAVWMGVSANLIKSSAASPNPPASSKKVINPPEETKKENNINSTAKLLDNFKPQTLPQVNPPVQAISNIAVDFEVKIASAKKDEPVPEIQFDAKLLLHSSIQIFTPVIPREITTPAEVCSPEMT